MPRQRGELARSRKNRSEINNEGLAEGERERERVDLPEMKTKGESRASCARTGAARAEQIINSD